MTTMLKCFDTPAIGSAVSEHPGPDTVTLSPSFTLLDILSIIVTHDLHQIILLSRVMQTPKKDQTMCINNN